MIGRRGRGRRARADRAAARPTVDERARSAGRPSQEAIDRPRASTRADWNRTGRPSPASTTPRPGVSGPMDAAASEPTTAMLSAALHHAERDADGAVRRDLLAHDAVRALGGEHEVHAERPPARGDVGDHRAELGEALDHRLELVDDEHEARAARRAARARAMSRTRSARSTSSRWRSSARRLSTARSASRLVEVGHDARDVRQAADRLERRAALEVDEEERHPVGRMAVAPARRSTRAGTRSCRCRWCPRRSRAVRGSRGRARAARRRRRRPPRGAVALEPGRRAGCASASNAHAVGQRAACVPTPSRSPARSQPTPSAPASARPSSYGTIARRAEPLAAPLARSRAGRRRHHDDGLEPGRQPVDASPRRRSRRLAGAARRRASTAPRAAVEDDGARPRPPPVRQARAPTPMRRRRRPRSRRRPGGTGARPARSGARAADRASVRRRRRRRSRLGGSRAPARRRAAPPRRAARGRRASTGAPSTRSVLARRAAAEHDLPERRRRASRAAARRRRSAAPARPAATPPRARGRAASAIATPRARRGARRARRRPSAASRRACRRASSTEATATSGPSAAKSERERGAGDRPEHDAPADRRDRWRATGSRAAAVRAGCGGSASGAASAESACGRRSGSVHPASDHRRRPSRSTGAARHPAAARTGRAAAAACGGRAPSRAVRPR